MLAAVLKMGSLEEAKEKKKLGTRHVTTAKCPQRIILLWTRIMVG